MTSKKTHKLNVEKYLGTRKDGASSSKGGEKINTGGNGYQQRKQDITKNRDIYQ